MGAPVLDPTDTRFLKGWGRVTVPDYLAFTRNRVGSLREIVHYDVVFRSVAVVTSTVPSCTTMMYGSIRRISDWIVHPLLISQLPMMGPMLD